MKDRLKIAKIKLLISLPIVIYIVVASTVYRFRHPELTQTQLVLHFFDAMTWKK